MVDCQKVWSIASEWTSATQLLPVWPSAFSRTPKLMEVPSRAAMRRVVSAEVMNVRSPACKAVQTNIL